jgi:drug/metabolite transporter (DMT)-like permease
MGKKNWLYYAIITTLLWGIWGALIELPEKAGYPATLGYVVWALMLIPVAIIALKLNSWKLEKSGKAISLGLLTGILGCGGQLILFQCLILGPAYIVFPIISLFPVVTIILSIVLLREKANRTAWIGIFLSLIAIVLLSYQPPDNSIVSGYLWLIMAIAVFILWGLQAFFMKLGGDAKKENSIQPESFTFYTMIVAILLMPVALMMTDFSNEINYGLDGMFTAIVVQSLNAIGYLFFAYTIRYGKAIIVVPMMSLAPVITILLSLLIYRTIPNSIIVAGIVVAFIAIYLMAKSENA